MNNYEKRFECRECSTTIHPASYRASCPDCGGALRTATRRYGDGTKT